MVYAIFLCTYVAALPHVSQCQLLGSVDPSLVVFDDKQKCEQAAAQKNSVWHDKPGATMWVRYVCLDKPAPEDPLQ